MVKSAIGGLPFLPMPNPLPGPTNVPLFLINQEHPPIKKANINSHAITRGTLILCLLRALTAFALLLI